MRDDIAREFFKILNSVEFSSMSEAEKGRALEKFFKGNDIYNMNIDDLLMLIQRYKKLDFLDRNIFNRSYTYELDEIDDFADNDEDADDEEYNGYSDYRGETKKERIIRLVNASDWYGAMGIPRTERDLLVFTCAHSELLAEFSSDAEVCKALNKAMLKIRADKKPQAAQYVPPPQYKEPEEIRSDKKVIGRNDSCPCGSGLKYKYCCGKNISETKQATPDTKIKQAKSSPGKGIGHVIARIFTASPVRLLAVLLMIWTLMLLSDWVVAATRGCPIGVVYCRLH